MPTRGLVVSPRVPATLTPPSFRFSKGRRPMPDFGTTIQNPNFHSSPDQLPATVVETLHPGIRVEITGVLVNLYWPVRLPDGRTGFIHSDLVVRDASTTAVP